MTNVIYKTKATAVGARSGTISLSDNPTTFKLEKPKPMGGAGADKGLNPEQFLASGYSACYSSALEHVVTQNKSNTKLEKMECEVSLVTREGGYKFEINFMAYLSNTNDTEAKKLLEDAHKVCPFSYSFGTNIDIKTSFTLV